MFVIESAIDYAASALGLPASVIQEKNLLSDGDVFPYGQEAESEANNCWNETVKTYDAESIRLEIELFNKKNNRFKKGMALMPVCFGISFTKTRMNQGRALVHVYIDGSVGVSTGAVEMGQGVNTKILQVVATCFSLDPSRVRIHFTNTFRIANTSPTAASAAADLNGKAAELACTGILERLRNVAAIELKTTKEEIEIRIKRVPGILSSIPVC